MPSWRPPSRATAPHGTYEDVAKGSDGLVGGVHCGDERRRDDARLTHLFYSPSLPHSPPSPLTTTSCNRFLREDLWFTAAAWLLLFAFLALYYKIAKARIALMGTFSTTPTTAADPASSASSASAHRPRSAEWLLVHLQQHTAYKTKTKTAKRWTDAVKASGKGGKGGNGASGSNSGKLAAAVATHTTMEFMKRKKKKLAIHKGEAAMHPETLMRVRLGERERRCACVCVCVCSQYKYATHN